ncbi:transposase [Leptolyngbya sp. AN03gr2]|uniref:transposase n=1 Tax=unclassified Leptolyngbya TaxID=2650499 RepID=UPI003D31D3D0
MQDGEVLDELLHQIEDDIEQVTTDGAYDHRHCYEEIVERGAKPVIPPRKDAVSWRHGNRKAPPHPRDQTLRHIRKHGRKKWKRIAGYQKSCQASSSSGLSQSFAKTDSLITVISNLFGKCFDFKN